MYIVRANSFMNKETYLHASSEMGDWGKTNYNKGLRAITPKVEKIKSSRV